MRLRHRLTKQWLMWCAMAFGAASTSRPRASAHFAIELPNGYYIGRDRFSDLRIVNRQGKIGVPGPIEGYAVYRSVVTGLLGPVPPRGGTYSNESPLPETSAARYFVLDTISGRALTALNVSAWKRELAWLGVPEVPAIKAPTLPSEAQRNGCKHALHDIS